MIKFFRHIRKSLLEQNKMGKYFKYAIGEIVLVMIGILLALQVSNWNENRKLKSQELILLKSLQLEIKQNKDLLDNYLDYTDLNINNLSKLLDITNPEYIEKKEDSLAYKLAKTFTIYNFTPEIMTLKAAQNSNSIKLIRNENIKKELSKWEQSLKILGDYDSFTSEYFNETYTPIISNYFPFVNIRYYRTNEKNFNVSKHKSELEKLFRSRDFENVVYRMRNFYRIRVSNAKQLKIYTEDLIQLLDNELKHHD